MSARVRTAGLVMAGLVVVALLALLAVSQVRADEVVPGVTIAGVDVGGLGSEDTAAALEELLAQRADEQVVLVHEGEEFVVDPTEVGVDLAVQEVVDEALGAGRQGSFVEARWAAVVGVDTTVEADVTLDEQLVRARVQEIAADVDTGTVEGAVSVDPVTLDIVATQPQDGVSVRVDDTVDAVLAAFDEPGPDELELPVEVLPSRTDDRDVTEAATTATAAVSQDLVLTSEDGELALTPREVAPLLSSVVVGPAEDGRIELVVTEEAVEEHVVPVAEPLLRDPVDASYQVPRRPSVTYDDMDDATWRPVPADSTVVPGVNGTVVDPTVAADQLTAAVRAGETTVALRLAEEPPAFSTADAEAVAPDTLLSTFTTYHSCCQSRVTNIQRLADLVDETIVMPGEQFSINQISGERTCGRGFAEAGMILNGEIVDVCGGGVSQFGTTTVNAVFFAGLDPDAYKPHSFYISRYPMAREATLNYPSPDIDVRFTNDTGAPIVVRTSYTGTSITVSFYGRSDVVEVRADVGGRYNIRPFRTERRVNRGLAPQASTVVQSGLDGFSVNLTRTVVREGGETTTDNWGNTYVAKTQIIEYNPAPRPDPEPADGDE